jgi:aspartokinase/homoserine dehydrogenase 1
MWEFLNKLTEFDPIYEKIKADPNHVLRYIGELSGDLQNDKGNLEVKLVSVPSDTALGGLKGSDSFFEIYTRIVRRPTNCNSRRSRISSNGKRCFGDILRLSDKG